MTFPRVFVVQGDFRDGGSLESGNSGATGNGASSMTFMTATTVDDDFNPFGNDDKNAFRGFPFDDDDNFVSNNLNAGSVTAAAVSETGGASVEKNGAAGIVADDDFLSSFVGMDGSNAFDGFPSDDDGGDNAGKDTADVSTSARTAANNAGGSSMVPLNTDVEDSQVPTTEAAVDDDFLATLTIDGRSFDDDLAAALERKTDTPAGALSPVASPAVTGSSRTTANNTTTTQNDGAANGANAGPSPSSAPANAMHAKPNNTKDDNVRRRGRMFRLLL
jgi:hypothetical protein